MNAFEGSNRKGANVLAIAFSSVANRTAAVIGRLFGGN
jgi:hypothetical protein